MSLEHPSWWDAHSDQPYKLARSEKPRLQAANLNEYLRTALCALGSLPTIAWHYARPKRIASPTPRDFVGLGVSPDHGSHQAVSDLVEELGVQNLLLRVPSWHADKLDYYLDFAGRFKGH
ncbi:MAG TPA: hypothetical protein DCW50_09800, partial [Gammaproteobacteria bacterium]|nr:hypothetical protein [Gammaproteobacteria bacterium]